jgi:transcriptional regulator with PAS, ATPase and Fis domain
MNSFDTVVIVIDSLGNIVWVNEKWKEITKLSNGHIIGKSIDEVIKNGDCTHCPDQVSFSLKEIITNYGKVLIAHRTNGLEHACDTFNGIMGKNKMVIERMRKSWSMKEQAIQMT